MVSVHSDMISVGIVEDDTNVREALQEYFNSLATFQCQVAVESAEKFLAVASQPSGPDVILMDIGLPGMSGIDATRLFRSVYPDSEIIMLTIYHDPEKIFDSLCAGASGYLLKTAPFSEIRGAVELVYNGGAPMSAQIARKVIGYFRPAQVKESESPLTAKEREVIFGLVDGLSYKMIADRMMISIETVRSHIKSIYNKLHVHSKAEVIGKSFKGEI
ncbi:MAG TPA: response regulator transcription factor [Bacteroidota bacterium]|nr:response regulator transcription factor [Bacteroidota bacterium]